MPDWALNRRRLANQSSMASAEFVAGDAAAAVDISSLAADLPQLQSLLRISHAVLGANFFDEALEVVAEQALIALQAASLSISRWDRENNVLRTLINVGDLGPDERRWPQEEVYPLTVNVFKLLQQGRPYLNSIDDRNADPAGLALLKRLRKESELAVAVMYDDLMWGELWVSGTGGRRFGPDDTQLLQAIAAHIAAAIGRAELFSTIWRYAFEDPLTKLPNRRKLEECLDQLSCEADRPVVLVCDLDGFKTVNDRDGHPAGDELLRTVAGVLADTASSRLGSLVARLGGDEFCVILPHSTVGEAEQFARQAGRSMAQAVGPDTTFSWGAAEVTSGTHSPHELIYIADMAMLEAKSQGSGRFSVGVAQQPVRPTDGRRVHGRSETGRRSVDGLVPQMVSMCEAHRPEDAVSALKLLGSVLCNEVQAAGWSVSVATDDATAIRSMSGIDSGLAEAPRQRALDTAEGTPYSLADFPAAQRALAEGATFVAARDLEGSSPAEIAHLERYGYHGVLGVGTADSWHRYLLEIYSDSQELDLTELSPYVQVLAHYCTAIVRNV